MSTNNESRLRRASRLDEVVGGDLAAAVVALGEERRHLVARAVHGAVHLAQLGAHLEFDLQQTRLGHAERDVGVQVDNLKPEL